MGYVNPPSAATPGTIHTVPPNLLAFEPSRSTTIPSNPPTNTILWIGGQFDTLLSTTYPQTIAAALPPSWTLYYASLSSSGFGWAVSSISRDAAEIARLATYIRTRQPGKLVLMGHSTGCQGAMEYVVGPPPRAPSSSSSKDQSSPPPRRAHVDGIILQAPVSDREALGHTLPAELVAEGTAEAHRLCAEGRGGDAISRRFTAPVFGRVALSARRWLDLASPGPEHAGADDYFSSDLGPERLATTFGKLPPSTPLLVLFSGEEEYVPPEFDKEGVVKGFLTATERGGGRVDGVDSGVIPGASHNLNGQEEAIVGDLVGRVVRFLGRVEKGEVGHGQNANL